jgi:hypothetical protein
MIPDLPVDEKRPAARKLRTVSGALSGQAIGGR